MQAHCFNFMQEVAWSLVKWKVYSKVNSLQCFRAKGEGNIYVKYIYFINQTLAQYCGFYVLNEARIRLNKSDSLMFWNVSSWNRRQNSHLHACWNHPLHISRHRLIKSRVNRDMHMGEFNYKTKILSNDVWADAVAGSECLVVGRGWFWWMWVKAAALFVLWDLESNWSRDQ